MKIDFHCSKFYKKFHRFYSHCYLLRYVLDCLTTESPRVANVVNVALKTEENFVNFFCFQPKCMMKYNSIINNYSFALLWFSKNFWTWFGSAPMGLIRLKSKYSKLKSVNDGLDVNLRNMLCSSVLLKIFFSTKTLSELNVRLILTLIPLCCCTFSLSVYHIHSVQLNVVHVFAAPKQQYD